MWLLVAPRAAQVLMVMRASGSSRLILASTPRNGVVRGSQPETTARKSSRRLTRRCPVALHMGIKVCPERNRHGEPPSFATLNQTCLKPTRPNRVTPSGTWYNMAADHLDEAAMRTQ